MPPLLPAAGYTYVVMLLPRCMHAGVIAHSCKVVCDERRDAGELWAR